MPVEASRLVTGFLISARAAGAVSFGVDFLE